MSGQIVRKRCVLLMGKSGAGKSTVANQLVGHDPMSPYNPPFGVSKQVLQSVTREVKHEVVKFMEGNIMYEMTVIDTVGLFDTEIKGQDPIFDKIEAYLKDYVDGINLILFVFKKGRLTAEEQEVFSFIRGRFDEEISPISALAVTACENDTAEARRSLVREFQVNDATRQIASQMKKGIYPVGFPAVKDMIPALQHAYSQQMLVDRNTLRNLVIRSEKLHLTRKLFVEKVMPVIKYIEVERRSSGGCTIL